MEVDQKHLIEPQIGVERQITTGYDTEEECQTWFDHIAMQGMSTPIIKRHNGKYEVWAKRYR